MRHLPRAYPSAEQLFKGDALPEGCGPYVFNHSLAADTCSEAEHAFREEPWSTVLTEVTLPEEAAPEFLAAAARFCNERLWGTLSATLVIHPAEEKSHPEALSKCVVTRRRSFLHLTSLTDRNIFPCSSADVLCRVFFRCCLRDRFLREMRYGVVAVNTSPAVRRMRNLTSAAAFARGPQNPAPELLD